MFTMSMIEDLMESLFVNLCHRLIKPTHLYCTFSRFLPLSNNPACGIMERVEHCYFIRMKKRLQIHLVVTRIDNRNNSQSFQ